MAAKPSMLRAFVAVAWSFLGIRKDSEYQIDVTQLSFGQVVVAGLISVALFIGALIGLVYWVTH